MEDIGPEFTLQADEDSGSNPRHRAMGHSGEIERKIEDRVYIRSGLLLRYLMARPRNHGEQNLMLRESAPDLPQDRNGGHDLPGGDGMHPDTRPLSRRSNQRFRQMSPALPPTGTRLTGHIPLCDIQGHERPPYQ